MRRLEEYNKVKGFLNRIVEGGNKEFFFNEIIKIQEKDPKFIKNMLLNSSFYDDEVHLIRNFRAVDILEHDIRAFMLIKYEDLIKMH